MVYIGLFGFIKVFYAFATIDKVNNFKAYLLCIKTHPRQNDPVYQYIVKKESEGKAKKAAKIAGLNKFLRIYYARVKEVYNGISE